MIKNLLWKLLGKKYLLGGVVAVYKALEGKKTLLATVATGAVYLGKTLGYVPPELADQLMTVFGGMGAVTLTSKLSRIDTEFKVQERASELRAAAMEQLKADGVITPPAKP